MVCGTDHKYCHNVHISTLSCYGAETPDMPCCNTCEQVREAYRQKGWAFNNPQGIEQCTREGWTDKLKEQVNEGCRAHGYLEVSKVAGNFHFAPGKSFQQHNVHGKPVCAVLCMVGQCVLYCAW